MSSIACNAETRAQGVFSNISRGEDNFRDHLTQALALKLNFKTTQHANEKALQKLVKAKGSSDSLKQAVQSRAAVYGESLDASWFTKNFDLSKKTYDLQQRRLARSQIMGAVLVVAQVGAQNIRKLLSAGKVGEPSDLRCETRGTAGQFAKALAQAPVLEVLRFVDKEKTARIVEGLLQNADDMDYLQSLITCIGKESSINPTMNAVTDAFARSRIAGRFKSGTQSVELDILLQNSTKGPKDDDEPAPRQNKRRTQASLSSCFKRMSAPFNLADTVTDALCVIRPTMVPSTALNTAVDTNEGEKLPTPMTRRRRSKHPLDRLGHLTPGSVETEPPTRMCSSD